MLTTQSIEKALALCEKTMEDMEEEFTEDAEEYGWNRWTEFSIEKFFAFLLSPEFLEKYMDYIIDIEATPTELILSESFGRAIYEYQKGNEQLLQNLLNKIP